MGHRANAFITFVRYFFSNMRHIREVIVGLHLLILLGGVAIFLLENISFQDAIYFAFITGLSVGYGDITPETIWGRLVSVAIGVTGVIYAGVAVAVVTQALADTIKQQEKPKP